MIEIIPAVDIWGGKAVRLTRGGYDTAKVYWENPADAASYWADQGAARLHVVDLDGAKAGKLVNLGPIAELRGAFTRFIDQSGGIRDMETARQAFDMGADFIALGSSLAEAGGFIRKAVFEYPGKVIASADLKSGTAMARGWTQSAGLSAGELAKLLSTIGISTAIVTDVIRDGALKGASVDAALPFITAGIDVIVSGGIGSLEHLRLVAKAAKGLVDAGKGLGIDGAKGLGSIVGIIVGKALYEGIFTLDEARGAATC